ncbi:hypothetical protein Ddc_08421 [Ditylenchus destructor]|nr:hypothetical protein Ddc_08421 [Ditylenchus destructor]
MRRLCLIAALGVILFFADVRSEEEVKSAVGKDNEADLEKSTLAKDPNQIIGRQKRGGYPQYGGGGYPQYGGGGYGGGGGPTKVIIIKKIIIGGGGGGGRRHRYGGYGGGGWGGGGGGGWGGDYGK